MKDLQSGAPVWRPETLRAVLLDVDGTLYYQARLRMLMALELSMLPFTMFSGQEAYQTWRALRIFRRVRETLRHGPASDVCLERWQYEHAAQQAGVSPARMEHLVTEWLYQRPLKYMALCRRRGLRAFLTFLQRRRIQIGVFSDYPVLEKLTSLGVADLMSVTLCATDPAINAFKPWAPGFTAACTLWGLHPHEVLYVGDRPEIDAIGAAKAGMPCVILGRPGPQETPAHTSSAYPYTTFASFPALQHALRSGV